MNGRGSVGKDTFVELVGKFAKVQNFSSVDEVKRLAMAIGWDGQKDERGRRLLSDLKDLLTAYDDGPFCYLQKCVEQFKNSNDEFCFLHIREPEEIARAKEEFGALAILVIRPSLRAVTGNHADENVDNFMYDIYIQNDKTLEYLEEVARGFALHFIEID